MKTIASFGAFVSDTWAIWLFAFGAGFWGLVIYNAPPTVTLDARHFECTMAIPDGIGTKCIEYAYKGRK